MNNVMFPPTCINIHFNAKAGHMVVDPVSTLSHCSRSFGYDRHVLSFLDVMAKECIEHVNVTM